MVVGIQKSFYNGSSYNPKYADTIGFTNFLVMVTVGVVVTVAVEVVMGVEEILPGVIAIKSLPTSYDGDNIITNGIKTTVIVAAAGVGGRVGAIMINFLQMDEGEDCSAAWMDSLMLCCTKIPFVPSRL